MKNQSLLIVAAVAAAAAATATIVVSNRSGSESAKAKEAAPLFPGLHDKVNDVAKIKVRRGTVEATLAKVPGDKSAWVLESRGNYPVEFDRVRQAIGGLAEAVIIEPKTAKPEFYDRLGVADAEKPGAVGTRVEFDDASGKAVASLIVGKASQEGAGGNEPGGTKARYFIRRDDEAQTYLAKGDLSVQPEPLSWVNKSIVELEGSKVKSVTVTQTPPGGAPETITVGRNTAADPKFTIENVPAGRQLKDESKVTSIGQAFTSLSMDDVAPVAGMDFSKPEAVVEAKLFDGETVTAKMVTKDGKKWFAIEAAYEEPAGMGAPATDEPPKTDTPPPTPAAAKPDASKPDAPKPEGSKPEPSKPETLPDPAKQAAAKAEAAKAEAAKAQAAEKAAVIKRVAEINEKCGPWAYVLPEYKVTQMLPKLDDLLKPAEAPAPTAPAPATPPANDSGSLLGPH